MEELAKLISSMTSPKIIMTVTLLGPSLFYLNIPSALIIPAITCLTFIAVKMWERKMESEDLSDFEDSDARQVRYSSLVVGVICFFAASFVANLLISKTVSQFYLIAGVVYLFVLIGTVTFQSRLSLHTSSLGLAVMFVFLMGFDEVNYVSWLIVYTIALLPVAWSRMKLKKHSTGQIFIAYGITIACSYIFVGATI